MTSEVFHMHVLAAGHGDCLWIEYGDAIAPARILVDAGTPGTFKRLGPKLAKVRGSQPSHELFLITHIDADHIGGSLKVLETPDAAAQFKEVWFNGRKHLDQAKGLEDFGAVQAERLTRAILDNKLNWNVSVGGGPLTRRSKLRLQSHEFAGAKVTVLTPTPHELVELIDAWDEEITKAGLDPKKPLKASKEPLPGYEALGIVDVEALANRPYSEDTAPANGSSISTLIEFKGIRVLLGADAHPSVLLAGIRQLHPEGPLEVDVFKLPHHGSAANVTSDLLDAVNAKTVVLSSNGAYFKHPDQTAVARVLRRYKTQGVHLVFNYRSTLNEMWDSDSLRLKWNYTTEYGSGTEGVTVQLMSAD